MNSQYSPGNSQSIPYELGSAERDAFFARQTANEGLNTYLFTLQPPWGMAIREAYGTILVWYDASRRLRVIDITNMGLEEDIAKAPYEEPGSSLVDNLLTRIKEVASQGVRLGLGALFIVVALMLFERSKK